MELSFEKLMAWSLLTRMAQQGDVRISFDHNTQRWRVDGPCGFWTEDGDSEWILGELWKAGLTPDATQLKINKDVQIQLLEAKISELEREKANAEFFGESGKKGE